MYINIYIIYIYIYIIYILTYKIMNNVYNSSNFLSKVIYIYVYNGLVLVTVYKLFSTDLVMYLLTMGMSVQG